MIVSSWAAIKGDHRLEMLWDDGERVFCREQQLNEDGTLGTILTVRLAAEHPTQASLDQFAHEYALREELDRAWALRPLALIRERSRSVLILEDFAGEPLAALIGAPMELGCFLRLAIAIATGLTRLHRRGFVHKDLKPANILVSAAGEVRFTGFGIATHRSRERQALEPPETIAGTLAYMAPEQTGRMNRSVDSRSDLYALGVTLYQMLTGRLPFVATDPIEWVHCHVARRAIPPAERTKDVPGTVSAIIMKLLAKTAEDRYQTAAGLKSDLERCLAEWDASGSIDNFALGENDEPDQILIPEKLYGREDEIKTLLAAFDGIAKSGAPRLVLVTGYSGIGKSTLVHELDKALPSIGGLFASGKFDQYKRDIPYATLAQAFQSVIRQLLAKSDAELAPWRDALREALDPLGGLLIDLVPELKVIIGSQPPVPEVSPQNARQRFQLLFRRFIGVFARPEHPFALFLDDLQWLDAATLDLLEDILTRSDLKHLLLVGAYRHNEVSEAHPLIRKLRVIRDVGAEVDEIRLRPLARDDVQQYTADALRSERKRTARLAQLVHEKTGGNPFFLIQFLCALAEEGLLSFDHDQARWRWDLERIHAKGYTENVGDLMAGKLSGLPIEARNALLELACLGNSAGVTILSLVHRTSEQRVHADLQDAVRLDLIERLDTSYKFVHDRVREAAYALLPDEDRPALHLRIGMMLAAQTNPIDAGEDIYVIANQLNRGVLALTREDERRQIIAVNLAAGQRARKAAAYHAAIVYLEVARDLLGAEAHPSCSPTSFAVGLLLAECEFLVGRPVVAEAQLLVLSQNCTTLEASGDVARLRAQLYTSEGQIGRAVEVCLEFLRQVGINWSSHPSRSEVDEDRLRLRRLAEKFSDEQLHALPLMEDPGNRATMKVLADLNTPAFLTDRNLSDIMLLAAARLTLEHGVCPGSCYPLAAIFGVLASNSADAELGYRLSQFGAALADQQPQSGLSGRALLVFGLHVAPWIRPIRSGRPFIQRGLTNCLVVGDLAFAAYSHRGLVSVSLFCGDPLREVCNDVEQALAFAEASGLSLSAKFLSQQKAAVLELMGRDWEQRLEVSGATEPNFIEGSQPLSEFFYHAAQVQISALAGHYHVALTFAKQAEELAWCARAYLEFAEYRFYTGLAHAAAYDISSPERRDMHVNGLREQHRKLTAWSKRIPANFAARQALIAAEVARIEGRALEAEHLFEEAIRLAREASFPQIEAIAAERAAYFYEARGIRTVVLAYLTTARDGYLRWGAEAKVRQLDAIYPELKEKETAFSPTNTIEASVEQLDLATVLKVSEAVSGEIVPEKLVDTLLRMAIEHAGAERGVLIQPHGTELRTQAEATTDSGSIAVDLRSSPILDADLPTSLILYAARTQENVILDDAAARGAFTSDPYVSRKQARSVLCLPLTKQGKSVALLYLENNLAPHAFTPGRVAVLKFLAFEAATSLDNARLYQELQERESRIRRLVDSNIIGMHIFNEEGIIVDANHAFLKLVGYDREDLATGRLRYIELTPPEWLERSARAHLEMATTGAIQPFEKEYFRKDGSRVPVVIGSAAFDEQRRQGVTFVLDLSARKRAEAEARESEQRYRETRMELEHAHRVAVMGQLTASIAHEVSQPNTAVVASAQAALHWLDRKPPEMEGVRQALARIIQNGMRASEVIERIRDLIKKKPPRKDRLAINPIIREVVELTQTEAAKNGVSVQTEFGGSLPEIVGDQVELQQVAVNLILNAIEAMSETAEGQRKLLVRTALADGNGIVVAVMDSGPGLPPTSIERLFDPFYTTKPGGLGIGLSICRSIIEGHGGRLWVSANLPHGAVFQFTVPAGDERMM
jgi:PAS domain S-box-containing protein